MAITATLRQTTCVFHDDGTVSATAYVELHDSTLGRMETRPVILTDPALLAGIRQAATALAPATELTLGVPLAVPG